jgi:seryl-tRNA synthetase
MISIKELRDNPSKTKTRLNLKNDYSDIDIILNLDSELRALKTKANSIRSQRNKSSELIANLMKTKRDASVIIKETRLLGDKLKDLDKTMNSVQIKLNSELLKLPNLPLENVPTGKNSDDNIKIRSWGDKPSFSFKPKTHLELNEKLSFIDLKRGSKISGSGFPLFTGQGAKLERCLINSMIDHHCTVYNSKELLPSVLMTKESMLTTGQLPKFQDDMYHTEVDNLFLAPTAEVPVTNIHRDEIIDEDKLPFNYVAYSPCFRRESGSYGKDTRGLLRVHQFNKVELVKFTTPETSLLELEKITTQAESILKKLGLKYRVIELCTGDLSFSAAKCYDIEVWAPGEQKWLEVSSCSNFQSFQAIRGNIRYRKKVDKKVEFLHTLNGSGLATPRLFVALIETYQNKEGKILFPDHIADFLGIREII